jgi:tetrahydromethanopterin S-methyltransferase subunit G
LLAVRADVGDIHRRLTNVEDRLTSVEDVVGEVLERVTEIKRMAAPEV